MPNRPALIVAHPGHELMILGWVEEARPEVFVLTDGSGRNGVSRTGSTLRILQALNAGVGSVFGAVSDLAVYQAALQGKVELFTGLTIRLSDALIAIEPEYVVGDAGEGFNPVHDICRAMIDAAVARARRSGTAIGNYEFRLFSSHDESSPAGQAGVIRRELDEEQLMRKLAVARSYPELAAEVGAAFSGSSKEILHQFPDLSEIVDASIEKMSERSLGTECLTPVERTLYEGSSPPFYELYGQRLVAEGVYEEAIEYQKHILPIERALAALA